MDKKNLFLLIFILLNSCAIFNSYERQINNFQYPNELAPNKVITMQDGYFEKELTPGTYNKIQASVLYFKEGDLNNDNEQDAAVIINISSTGEEIFYYLYIFTGKNGNLNYANHILLGDRIKIKLFKILNNKIYLAYLTKGPKDSFDNPTSLQKIILKLKENKIVLLKKTGA